MRIVPAFALLALAACDQARTPEPTPDAAANTGSANAEIARDTAKLETDIRVAAANKRIDELERKVAALTTTPATIEIDLLTQRVQAMEAKIYARDEAPAPRPSATPSAKPSPNAKAGTD